MGDRYLAYGIKPETEGRRRRRRRMAEEKADTKPEKKKEIYRVLPKRLGGGPCGLGDPNDKTLRKIEKDVLIMEKVREKSRKEKCVSEVKAFSECCRGAQLSMTWTCRKETNALKECCGKWFKDEEFIAECTKEYLDERSEYRRTGIGKKKKAFSQRMKSNM